MSEEVVGPVEGPISEFTVTSDVYTPSDAQYDIAIGGLPFRKAPSDERPYARETADFRKQQFDQSSNPGDQSLTGYWTRGQLSFHRGAGIRFYEILDGDTILNRFTDSLGVDPWTPGQVTLRAPVTKINSTATVDAVLHDGGIGILNSVGTVQLLTYAGASTALALTAAGTSTSIASDGTNLYASNAAKIDVRAPGGAFSTLWTLTTGGRTVKYVWWAKSRLWVLDSAGELYTLSTVGGTFATGDANSLWKSPYAGTAVWSLTESEGSVFLAVGREVFASTIDGSAATPVLGAPLTVARVGAQETIGAIGAYLGYLTVTSTAGIRVGRIGDGLLLGDLILETDASLCRRLAYRKSLVLAAGKATSTSLYELDVLEQTSDLQPAYAPVRSLGTTSSNYGALVLPDGRVGYFSSAGVHVEDAALGAATGYVQTAFHRFGTLEPKDFRTVSLYATGTSGTIAASLVRRDGSVSPLAVLGPESFNGGELSLNLPDVQDFVGLRFTLTATDGVAPTLLGYQLRALPAPVRQRLIQIPLFCFDEEVIGKSKHGYRGWAKDRLFALENMERTSGAVAYQDFSLDERATVIIEKIQFQSVTPMREDGNGFGGFVMVTLRKVA